VRPDWPPFYHRLRHILGSHEYAMGSMMRPLSPPDSPLPSPQSLPFLRSVGSLPPIHYYPIYLMAFIGIRLLGAFCHLFRIDLPSPAVFHTLFALLLVHLHWVISICKFSVRFVKKLNSLWHNKQKKSPLVWLDLIVSEWI